MNNFTYPCKISNNTTVLLKELKFKDYKNLAKSLITDDKTTVSNVFNNVLNDICDDSCDSVTVLDKLKMLLTVRAVCIQPALDLIFTCPDTKKTFNVTLDIFSIIKNFETITVYPKKIILDDIELELNLPKSLNFYDADFISSLKIQHAAVKITPEIINELPIKLSRDISEYIENIDRTNNKFFSVRSPFTGKAIELPLSFKYNTILDFLKLAFKRDLMSIYELEYIICSKLKFDSLTLSNSTYAELSIYINLYKQEMEERRKSEKQLPKPGPGPI